jgi:hypothetical protein
MTLIVLFNEIQPQTVVAFRDDPLSWPPTTTPAATSTFPENEVVILSVHLACHLLFHWCIQH